MGTSNKNYYDKVINAILPLIRDGSYKEGEVLPSTSFIAESVNVSKPTAVYAYDILGAMGIVVSRAGAGTFVSRNALSILRTRHTLFSIPLPQGEDPLSIDSPPPPEKSIQHLKLKGSDYPLVYGRSFGGVLHEHYYFNPELAIHIDPGGRDMNEYLMEEWDIPVERIRYSIIPEYFYEDVCEADYIKSGEDITFVEVGAYTLNMKPLYWVLQAWGSSLGITLDVVRGRGWEDSGDMIIEGVNIDIMEEYV